MEHSRAFDRVGDKTVSYQFVKYTLLMLNIMIVTTTAILIVIVCLLPMVRKSQYETQVINLVRCLSIYEIDTIRIFRYAALVVSASIILNQTLAVYGLFRERPSLILLSSTLLGMLTQLTIFVLPTNAFLILLAYIVLSIAYVVLLNRIQETTKENSFRGGASSQAAKVCTCNCGGQASNYQPATIVSPTRKPSLHGQYYQPSSAYYYGSLGRRSREPRPMLSPMINKMNADNVYGQQAAGQYGHLKVNRNSNPPPMMMVNSMTNDPSLDSSNYINKPKQ